MDRLGVGFLGRFLMLLLPPSSVVSARHNFPAYLVANLVRLVDPGAIVVNLLLLPSTILHTSRY